jgi:hypothetical protein
MRKILKWGLILIVIILIILAALGKNKGKHTISPTPSPAGANGGMLIGMDASGDDYRKVAKEAGINYVHNAPTWNSIESKEGKYNFGELQKFADLAKENNAPLNLVFRTIDTGNRSMIEPYASMSFDDPRMAAALIKLFKAMPASIKSEVGFVTIGNETDQYFSAHKNEIQAYAKLLDAIKPTLNQEFPGKPITVNFTWGGAGFVKSDMKPITDRIDFYSFNYYHMNPDFTVRDPKKVGKEIDGMVAASGLKKLLIEELGMPSSAANNSSEDIQADFVKYSFEAIRKNQDRILAANFLWYSDLPQSVVDSLTSYYNFKDDKFAGFLGSIGFFTRDGKPKKAYEVFKTEAKATTKR